MTTLRTAIGTFGHTLALKDGRVAPAGFRLEHVEVDPMIAAYRRMIRDREFDISEMAPTTYLVARAYGMPFTALPIFLNHKFHHEDILCRNDAGIERPEDLRGKRVGVRAYTVTTGVFARGILQNEYGIDPAGITWVTDDEEHVAAFPIPANVVAAPKGEKLADLFRSGAIDAAFTGPAGVGGKPGTAAAASMHPLFRDAAYLQREWYKRTGIYPVHAMVVVKDEVLRAHPSLAPALMSAFESAKRRYLEELDAEGARDSEDERWETMRSIVGSDPLPYGIEPNRATIEALIDYSFQQRLIPERPRIDDLFAAGAAVS